MGEDGPSKTSFSVGLCPSWRRLLTSKERLPSSLSGPGSTGVRFICILSPDPCSPVSLSTQEEVIAASLSS